MTVADLYRTVLGREGEAAGLEFWTKAFGATVDSSEYAQFVKGAIPELDARSKAQEAAWLAPGGAAPAAPGADIAAALTDLNSQLVGLQTAMNRTANSTTQLAQQFDQVSAGGNALATESI